MAKKHPHSAERRDAERQETHHVLPARVILAATEVDLICRIVDASVSGLRVIVDQPLEVGTQLLLVTLA